MSCSSIKDIGVLLAGFAAGLLVSRLPHAAAASAPVAADPSQKKLKVSIDEIHQNFVFGDLFVGHYVKAVTMSDGSIRRIELTPMFHEGRQVVEFRDNRGVHYMGLNGTTTDGTLMVQIRDVDAMVALAKADGWPSPPSAAFRIMPALPVSVAFQRTRSQKSEAMTVRNLSEEPLNLSVDVFDSGRYVGTRSISVPAHASSTLRAFESWRNPAPASSGPGQGPQPGDQVTLIEIPNQAGSHEMRYQQWQGAVP